MHTYARPTGRHTLRHDTTGWSTKCHPDTSTQMCVYSYPEWYTDTRTLANPEVQTYLICSRPESERSER